MQGGAGAVMAPASVGRPDRRTIWRRRVVLMSIVGLLIAIPVTILVGGGADAPPSAAPLEGIEVKAPNVGPKKVEQSIGVELRVPQGWSREQKQEVLELQSKDGAARVAISAPGPAADADALHSQVVEGLRSSYGNFEVQQKIGKTKLGGLRGEATVASGTLKSKQGKAQQRMIVTTAEGRQLAYLVVVFTAGETSRSMLEAQALVNNLRFTK